MRQACSCDDRHHAPQIWWPNLGIFTGVDAAEVRAYTALPHPERAALGVADLEARFPAPSDWHLDTRNDRVWFVNSHCSPDGQQALYDWLADAGFAASEDLDYVGIRLEVFRRED